MRTSNPEKPLAPLEAHLASPASLSAPQRDGMFALMQAYYENMARDTFEADLNEKQWVIYLSTSDGGEIAGFSTQTLLEVEASGRTVRALYSGDTIMDQRHRASHALTRWWGRLALRLIDEYAGQELYWFLISKGYKTYRFLPVFFNEYYPRHDRETPSRETQVLRALAAAKYPASFDPDAGVIRAQPGGCCLRPGVADVTPERLNDPHVRFFVEANPGHARGDELCCLAPLTRANFKPSAYRAIGLPQGD